MMSLWNQNTDRLLDGKIYTLRRFKVERYPANATVRHLQFIGQTEVVIRDELATPFNDVTLSDYTWVGELVGFEDTYTYQSCSKCLKKLSTDTCATCKEEIIPNDFKVRFFGSYKCITLLLLCLNCSDNMNNNEYHAPV